MMNDNEVRADRQEKHIELHNTIQGTKSIIGTLDQLIARIKEPEPEPDEKALDPSKLPQPSLATVLTCGAEELRDMTNLAHKKITELTDLLF